MHALKSGSKFEPLFVIQVLEESRNQQFYQETFLTLVKSAQEKLEASTLTLQQELEKFQQQVFICHILIFFTWIIEESDFI